jgi:hypothetical protein
MATTAEDIAAAVEVAQVATGDALKILRDDTGVAIDAIEIVDAEADPPAVKITVSLASDEVVEPVDPNVPGPTIQEHFKG